MKKQNIILAHFNFNAKEMTPTVQIKNSLSRNWVKIPIIEPYLTNNEVLDSAIHYLVNKGFTIKGYGELKDHYCIIVEEFKSIK